MRQRRFTWFTNGFSKRLQNHAYALAPHRFHYHFVRVHDALRITPAMADGVTDRLRISTTWSG